MLCALLRDCPLKGVWSGILVVDYLRCGRLLIGSRVLHDVVGAFFSSLLLSSSTRRRFYPQRSSGQAVATGAVPSPPRYVPLILVAHRVQHSHCASIFI